jgi:hypothetical protein
MDADDADDEADDDDAPRRRIAFPVDDFPVPVFPTSAIAR